MDNKYKNLELGGLFTPKQRIAFARIIAELEKLRKILPMDNKYGHLYTAEDMLAFARIYAGSDVDIANDFNDDAADELLDNFEGRFPKDEPLFLLRGQDRRALGCVRNYRTMITYTGSQEPDPSLVAGLNAVVDQFEEFKRDYPERMKDPD